MARDGSHNFEGGVGYYEKIALLGNGYPRIFHLLLNSIPGISSPGERARDRTGIYCGAHRQRRGPRPGRIYAVEE